MEKLQISKNHFFFCDGECKNGHCFLSGSVQCVFKCSMSDSVFYMECCKVKVRMEKVESQECFLSFFRQKSVSAKLAK